MFVHVVYINNQFLYKSYKNLIFALSKNLISSPNGREISIFLNAKMLHIINASFMSYLVYYTFLVKVWLDGRVCKYVRTMSGCDSLDQHNYKYESIPLRR